MTDQEDDEPTPDEEDRKTEGKRARFLEWCRENGADPEDEGAWDDFDETDSFWDDLDEDDEAGWTDNMNKE